MDESSIAQLQVQLEALYRERREADPEQTPPTIDLAQTHRLAQSNGLSQRAVEQAALGADLCPLRYLRNIGTIGLEGQLALRRATVTIIGAGGLGGWIAEILARMGVGVLVLIDGDVFEEDNLNRQLACTEDSLGRAKVTVLAERLARVNSAVETQPQRTWFSKDNAADLLEGCDVVVDALDNLPQRMVLQDAAADLNLPLVHGAIAGYTGEVLTVMPGDRGLRAIYGEGPWPEHGIETKLGNPAATPMIVASWQAQQVVKLIVGQHKGLLRNRMLLLDSDAGDATIIELG